jgi:hypothetical protein
MHPGDCTVSYVSPDYTNPFRAKVRWVKAARVGVLLRSKEHSWRIIWFGAPRSDVHGGSWVFGGGDWTVSLRERDEEQDVPLEMRRLMGLDHTLQPKQ